jgi:hypothetical protein
LAFASTVTSAFTVEASTGPVSRIRPPVANSISTAPGSDRDATAAPSAGAIATGENTGAEPVRLQSACRHQNN